MKIQGQDKKSKTSSITGLNLEGKFLASHSQTTLTLLTRWLIEPKIYTAHKLWQFSGQSFKVMIESRKCRRVESYLSRYFTVKRRRKMATINYGAINGPNQVEINIHSNHWQATPREARRQAKEARRQAKMEARQARRESRRESRITINDQDASVECNACCCLCSCLCRVIGFCLWLFGFFLLFFRREKMEIHYNFFISIRSNILASQKGVQKCSFVQCALYIGKWVDYMDCEFVNL